MLNQFSNPTSGFSKKNDKTLYSLLVFAALFFLVIFSNFDENVLIHFESAPYTQNTCKLHEKKCIQTAYTPSFNVNAYKHAQLTEFLSEQSENEENNDDDIRLKSFIIVDPFYFKILSVEYCSISLIPQFSVPLYVMHHNWKYC